MKFVLYNEVMRRRLVAMGFTHLRYGKALSREAALSTNCENAICAEIIPLRGCKPSEEPCFTIDSSLARQSTMDAMTTFFVCLPETPGNSPGNN